MRHPVNVNLAPRQFDDIASLAHHLRLLGAIDVVITSESTDVIDIAVEGAVDRIDRLYLGAKAPRVGGRVVRISTPDTRRGTRPA